MFVRLGPLVGLILTIPPGGEPGNDYLPLREGNVWIYRAVLENDGKAAELEALTRVAGRRKVGDTECFVLEIRVGGSVAREFLAPGASGVLVYGESREGMEIFHDPPLRRLRYPLAAGIVWEDRPRGEAGEVRIRSTVQEEEEVEVPAGRYRTVPVRAEAETPAGKMDSRTWYAPGVGVVRQWVRHSRPGRLLELRIDLKAFEGAGPRGS